jgi:uncharacterized protein (TIGR02217 family)
MAFDEVLFDPALIAAGGSGSPEFANTIIRNPATGIYKININRYDPIEVWTIDLNLLTTNQQSYAIRFWRGGFGSAYGFRVVVPTDFKMVDEVVGTGNGVQTVFPLIKTYTRPGTSGHAYIRRITKPVANTNLTGGSVTLYEADGVTTRVIPRTTPPGIGQVFTVKLNGTPTSAYTIHNTTGNLTMTSAPGGGVVVTVSCEFDTPMRFLQNSFNQKVDVASDITGLILSEVLPAELGIT